MKYFLVIFLLGSFCCSKHPNSNEIDISLLQADSLIRLHQWSLLGPFYPDSNIAVLDRINQDLLLPYGKTEKDLTNINKFVFFGKELSKDKSFQLSDVYIPHYILDLEKYFKIEPPISAYLGCHIESSATNQVALNISAYQSAKFWLNGEEIYNIEWKRGRSKFREDYVPITLKKGSNFLLIKLSVSDIKYTPAQWRIEVDISSLETAKKNFSSCYAKHFIRNSLVEGDNLLKIYTGPFSITDVCINLYKKGSSEIIFNDRLSPNRKTGDINIPLSEQHLKDGIYTCELITDDNRFQQDFFFGDIDLYFDSLQQEYRNLKGLTNKQKLNMEGLVKRVYIKGRRDKLDFDDQVEYWNRIRIPSLVQLVYAIEQLKNNRNPADAFFLRGYFSPFWEGENYYSAHLPSNYRNFSSLPVFIILIDTEIKVRNWTDHWRNSVANGLTEIINIANELGFIVAWTDCGGKIDSNKREILFDEIINDIYEEFSVNSKEMYVLGYCASTDLALNMLNRFPETMSGCGLINPKEIGSEYINNKNNHNKHKLTMIYAKYDEVIDELVSLSTYNNLKSMDSTATIYRCNYSSHYNNPSDYMKPIFIDLLTRTN